MLKKLLSFLLSAFTCIVIIKITACVTDIALKGSFKYTWLFLNHTIQLIICIAVMSISIWSKSLYEWGINLKNRELTFAIVKKFALGWIICTTVYITVLSCIAGSTNLLDFPLDLKNASIYLLFESTIVGAAEEVLFRGLVYGILIKTFSEKIKLPGFSVSQAAVISAVLFAAAHIDFQVYPFIVISFDAFQIIAAFALGIFYAFILEKTDSLLGAVLAHNISDAWLSVLYIIVEVIGQRQL